MNFLAATPTPASTITITATRRLPCRRLAGLRLSGSESAARAASLAARLRARRPDLATVSATASPAAASASVTSDTPELTPARRDLRLIRRHPLDHSWRSAADRR